MICNVCEGTGFLNLHQINDPIVILGFYCIDLSVREQILKWCENNSDHDVSVCNCCGDGERWYGVPGRHYEGFRDPKGDDGPYAYNGGLCECH